MTVAQYILGIVAGMLVCTGFYSFVQFLIQRKDNKTEELDEIKKSVEELNKKLDKNEKDNCRLQLLVMTTLHENETQEILKLAEHYFVECNGNWYYDSLFRKWLSKNNVTPPSWFQGRE